jgi:hypothetical protein
MEARLKRAALPKRVCTLRAQPALITLFDELVVRAPTPRQPHVGCWFGAFVLCDDHSHAEFGGGLGEPLPER